MQVDNKSCGFGMVGKQIAKTVNLTQIGPINTLLFFLFQQIQIYLS